MSFSTLPLFFSLFFYTVGSAQDPVQPHDKTRFAVIGDFGLAGPGEDSVCKLVMSWSPDYIITTGDNNYDMGAASTIDTNIGYYYHSYIGDYKGKYGSGSTTNRFFPCLGNHDWRTDNAAPYLDYFTLPGNERYYEFSKGSVRFFCIDSDSHEPDGRTDTSVQAKWLKERLSQAREPWKIVFFHHPPYSSGEHGNSKQMQWPFEEWGASAVLAGHDHNYERLQVGGIPYIVNGLGGKSKYDFKTTATNSIVRYNNRFGAMQCEADMNSLSFAFINVVGETIDKITLTTQ